MEIADQVFTNQAVPGESLTVEAGAYPYENPPLIDNVTEAWGYILKIYNQGNNRDTLLKMVSAGLPLEYISGIVTTSAFINGIYTVDVAEILKPAFLLQLLADARDKNIFKPKIFNNAEIIDFEASQYIDVLEELRPEEYNMLSSEVYIDEPELLLEEEEEGSFLDMEEV